MRFIRMHYISDQDYHQRLSIAQHLIIKSMETIQTKDGKLYKVQIELLKRYSRFYKVIIDDKDPQDEEPVYLPTISSNEFDFVFEFLQLHKIELPKPLQPFSPGIKLTQIMEEADAELIQRIFKQTQLQIKAVIEAAFYLQIDELKKRLTAGIVSGLDKQKTIDIYKSIEDKTKVNEDQIGKQIYTRIQNVLYKRKELLQQQQEPIQE